LVSNPFNPREFYNSSDIDEPAVCCVERSTRPHCRHKTLGLPGKDVIVDAERRFRAKKSLGDTTIDCEVVKDLTD
jgi:ParB family chromosome partitioning protein